MTKRRPSWRQTLIWRIEAFGFDLVGALFALMPIDVASAVGGAVLRRLGPLTGAHKTARRNLMIAFPDWDEAQRALVLDQQWENVGRMAAEFQMLGRLTAESGRVEVIGAERLEAIRKSGEAVVFVSGHLSNWEIMPMTIAHSGVRCQMTYRAANNPYIDRRIIQSRARYGVELFAPKGESGSREILEAWRCGLPAYFSPCLSSAPEARGSGWWCMSPSSWSVQAIAPGISRRGCGGSMRSSRSAFANGPRSGSGCISGGPLRPMYRPANSSFVP
jgi:KDO2-lipid IV(A) lauroyltransferase